MPEPSPTAAQQTGPILDPVNPGPKVNTSAKAGLPRWLLYVIGGTALTVLVVIGQKVRQAEFGEPLKKQPPKAATLVQKADKEVWMAEAVGQLKALEKALDTQNKQMTEMQRELERIKKEERKGPAGLPGPVGPPGGQGPAVVIQGNKPGVKGGPRPPLPPTSLPPLPPVLPGTPVPVVPGGKGEPAADGAPIPAGRTVPVLPLGKPGMKGAGPGSDGTHGTVPAMPPAPNERIRVFKAEPVSLQPKAKYWLNTGAMIPVQLISGIDAPARGGGVGTGVSGIAQQPYPVLMTVTELAVIPNDYRMDLKECFVLGEGIGELSSERTQIRVLGMSCVKRNGQATDIGLKGVITGEDGKVGLRGRVVMREGALLARSLLAGFVSGLSRAFLPFQQGFFLSQNPQQLLQFPDPQQMKLMRVAGGS
jgi:conjugal transfer pilus assembly protein TraB